MFKLESQFNYLLTLKNVHLSSNRYNFWMQPNIAMNNYVVWILLCKHCKFGEKIYYHSRDIEFFLGGPFLARPVFLVHCRHRRLLTVSNYATVFRLFVVCPSWWRALTSAESYSVSAVGKLRWPGASVRSSCLSFTRRYLHIVLKQLYVHVSLDRWAFFHR